MYSVSIWVTVRWGKGSWTTVCVCVCVFLICSFVSPIAGRQLSIEPLGSVSVSEDEAYVDAVRLR